MPGPLEGIRIIELTTTVAGPSVGMILGDQGADIIKVEPPMIGDLGRYMGPSRGGMAAMFTTLNRNKRSVALDFKDQRDLAIFRRLVSDADVLVENYRPGVVARLGIDYAALSAANPRLVYCSISGYGQSGPYHHRRVYDPLIQATAGASAAQFRERPTNVRSVIFDKVTGYTAAQAVTAALFARERSGRGEHLEISMLQSALYFQWADVMWSQTLQGDGVAYAGGELADWFDVYQARDGFVAVILVTDVAFASCCEFLGVDLLSDERFASLGARGANRAALRDALDAAMANVAVADVVAALDAVDVPVAAVNSPDTIGQDPQVQEQSCILDVEHPVAGPMQQAVAPFRFSGAAQAPNAPAPILGQHCREVLTELGVELADIERMEAREAENRERMQGFTLAQAT